MRDSGKAFKIQKSEGLQNTEIRMVVPIRLNTEIKHDSKQ